MGSPHLVEQCAKLYSAHYGKWSSQAPDGLAGKPIKLTTARLKAWFSQGANLYVAHTGTDELVGYAVAVQSPSHHKRSITWVTQLVVHSDYRLQDIGKTLLYSIWHSSNHFAWGLVSANPYAIRALEKATRRRCDPGVIAKHLKLLRSFANRRIHYLPKTKAYRVGRTRSRVDTEFFADHSNLNAKLDNVTSKGVPWALGRSLPEGWEWLAFTFGSQAQIPLSSEEVEMMLTLSDSYTKQAYGRMTLSPQHAWMQHAAGETSSIAAMCGLQRGESVLDLGCGQGRHAIELAKMGCEVQGIDYLQSLVEQATVEARKNGVSANATFAVHDCRTVRLGREFDAVVCLYDVVGTYAENQHNQAIIETAFKHTRPGGHFVVSAMNYEYTLRRANNKFSFATEPNRILTLPASSTMERTGNVFDPNFYLVDTMTQVVYRREQFSQGSALPTELIVRDRRFRMTELQEMCRRAGYDILEARVVNAGQWDVTKNLDEGKEIVIVCTKP
jgi:2-polyprenyl-3-methyl-5-hydroxy-6-metoxy-1,4-benzoquinol methylase/GNAT superfamily N-acetyltransferase